MENDGWWKEVAGGNNGFLFHVWRRNHGCATVACTVHIEFSVLAVTFHKIFRLKRNKKDPKWIASQMKWAM